MRRNSWADSGAAAASCAAPPGCVSSRRFRIKMAKTQDLPLNAPEVSGVCGRLLCCLAYENDFYTEARKQMPRVNSVVETPQGPGKVRQVHVLANSIKVLVEGPNETRQWVDMDVDRRPSHAAEQDSRPRVRHNWRSRGPTATSSTFRTRTTPTWGRETGGKRRQRTTRPGSQPRAPGVRSVSAGRRAIKQTSGQPGGCPLVRERPAAGIRRAWLRRSAALRAGFQATVRGMIISLTAVRSLPSMSISTNSG